MLAVAAAVAEDASARCVQLGSCGVVEDGDGPRRRLTAYFDGDRDPEALRDEIARALGPPGWLPGGASAVRLEVEVEADWGTQWRRHYRPVWATPHIVVHPPWIPVAVGPGQQAIAIDPAMAFGTGGHESTRLALEALEATGCRGRRCLDVGTGSGVLAIAAVRLGAVQVMAVDIDPVAVDNACHNARRNLGVDVARVRVLSGSVDLVAGERFDVIVANLEAHLVQPLLPALFAAAEPGGALLLSGILAAQRDGLWRRIAQAGWAVDAVWSRGEWIGCRARVA